MSAVVASGTTGALGIGVETNLEAARAPAAVTSYVYKVDCNALATGEVAIIRVYTVLLTGGAERLEYAGSYVAGAEEDPMQTSVPVIVDSAAGITIRASIEQKNGTGRTFPWKLFSL